MAAIQFYQNGAGGSTGADLAVLKPTYSSGVYRYVHKSGSDANAGTERNKPTATVVQAYANAAAHDTVVCLSGHTENISAGIDMIKAGLKIVGEGTGSQKPAFTVSYISYAFKMDAAGQLIDNLYFPPSSAIPVTEKIQVAAAFAYIDNCTFDQGTNDSVQAVSFVTGAGSCVLNNSTFTAIASGAAIGIKVVNALTGLRMNNVTFDGGSFTWTDYAFKGSAAITGLRATRMIRLNGSNVLIPTGSTGWWQDALSSGDSVMAWTA